MLLMPGGSEANLPSPAVAPAATGVAPAATPVARRWIRESGPASRVRRGRRQRQAAEELSQFLGPNPHGRLVGERFRLYPGGLQLLSPDLARCRPGNRRSNGVPTTPVDAKPHR